MPAPSWREQRLRGSCCPLFLVTKLLALVVAAALPAQGNASTLPHLNSTGSGDSQSPDAGAQPLGYSPPCSNGTIPGFTVLQQVTSDQYNIPGGWYALQVEYQLPPPNERVIELMNHSLPCFDVGHAVKQPRDELYRRRPAPPAALPGNVPRAFWKWEGDISRQQFDAVPSMIPQDLCPFCLKATRYQIIDGHLYRQRHPESEPEHFRVNLNYVEDLVLTVLHLWDLPDMDFIVHNGPACPPNGWPMIGWNICRDRHQAGFGWPYANAWRYALGPMQVQGYHQCMVVRYNHTQRRPVVFWRGSTTDPVYGDRNLRMDVVDKVNRIVAHKISEGDPVIDTKISNAIYTDDAVKAYLGELGKGPFIEDYAKSAIAMDIDGHGMSGRFGHRLVHMRVPVLKQASNHTAYFEHLVAPGHMLELYDHNLTDYQARAHHLLEEWATNPGRLLQQAQQLQGFAAALMHQMAVAEAAAYALLMYSKKLTWKTKRDPAYVHVPFSQVCGPDVNRLPRELCQEMKARPARP